MKFGSVILPDRSGLRRAFDEMRSAIDELCEAITEDCVINGAVFDLPAILKQDVTDNSPLDPEFISVNTINDRTAAISRTKDAYRNLWISSNPDISTRHPYRLPGALILDMNYSHIFRPLVERVNNSKSEFENQSLALPELIRFTELHDLFPGLMTIQACRKISLINEPLQSVRFFWANKQAISKVTKEEIITRLRKSQINPGRKMLSPDDQNVWFEKVENEIAAVMAVSDNAILRIRRPINVQPMARISRIEALPGEKQNIQQIPNPIPILVLSEKDGYLKLGELKDFDKFGVKHKLQPRKPKLSPIIERLHLYVWHKSDEIQND